MRKQPRTLLKKAAMIACVFALNGCATPEVVTASKTNISVNIMNTGMTASEMIRNGAKVAELHCAKFEKKANLVNTSGFLGAAHVAHFECK